MDALFVYQVCLYTCTKGFYGCISSLYQVCLHIQVGYKLPGLFTRSVYIRALKVFMDAFHHSYPDCRVLTVERMELSDYEKLIGKSEYHF